MNLGTLLRPWALRAAGPGRAPAPPVALSRRRSARRSLAAGAAALALLTAGMAVALDAVRPEWRDPEYYVRLGRLRRWQAEAPDRPLVVAFGSSRTQMGLCPAAMGYPDRPGSPLVFNMGYQGGWPLRANLQFARTLDAGVRPRAVLFQLASIEMLQAGPAEQQCAVWAPRLSVGDLNRLAPYTENPAVLLRPSLAARLNPWVAYRAAVQSDLVPDWQTPFDTAQRVWGNADDYGFIGHPLASLTPEQRVAPLARTRELVQRRRIEIPAAPITDRVLRDAVARCRAEGIAVAFFWPPISAAYRNWEPPVVRANAQAYQRWIETELGAPVFSFPPDDLLAEEDFADGFHLLRCGAEKYSRWLADAHLTPWLGRLGGTQ